MDANDISLPQTPVNSNFCTLTDAMATAGNHDAAPATAQPELADNLRDRPFDRWARGGFLSDVLPIMPTGAKLSPGSKVKPEQIGKIPGVYRGDGTWSGMRWRTRDGGPHVATWNDIVTWDRWPDSPRVGLIGTRCVGIDADILDAAFAAAVKVLAFEMLGRVSARIGNAPKFLLMYRLAAGIDKVKVKFFKDAVETGAVEVLSHKQQFVVDGIHPTTQQPYYYEGQHPANVGFDNWPATTVEQINEFLAALPALAEKHGYATKADRADAEIKADKADTADDLGAADGPANVVYDEPETVAWARQQIAAELAENGKPIDGNGTGKGNSDDRAYRLVGTLRDGDAYGYSLRPEMIAALLKAHWAPGFDYDWLLSKAERTDYENDPGCGPADSTGRAFGAIVGGALGPVKWPHPFNADGTPRTGKTEATGAAADGATIDDDARIRAKFMTPTDRGAALVKGSRSLADFRASVCAAPARQDLVPDYIASGMFIPLHAPGKHYKSLFLLQLMFAKLYDRQLFRRRDTETRSWLGPAPECGGVPVQRVEMLSYEDAEDAFHRRVAAMAPGFPVKADEADPGGRFTRHDVTLPILKISDRGDFELTPLGYEMLRRWEQATAEGGHTILWWDSFFDAVEMPAKARNEDSIARAAIRLFNHWCRLLNATIVTPLHPSRSGAERTDTGYAPAWENSPRQVLRIGAILEADPTGGKGAKRKTGKYVFEVSLWNDGPQGTRVLFSYDNGELRSDGDMNEAAPDAVQAAIDVVLSFTYGARVREFVPGMMAETRDALERQLKNRIRNNGTGWQIIRGGRAYKLTSDDDVMREFRERAGQPKATVADFLRACEAARQSLRLGYNERDEKARGDARRPAGYCIIAVQPETIVDFDSPDVEDMV